MLIKKLFWLVFAALILAVLMLPANAATEILKNGGFEQVNAEQKPENWVYDSWEPGAVMELTVKKSHGGKYALMFRNDKSNDVRAIQTIPVKPGTYYKFSGWIATENIPPQKVGANLCIMGGYDYTEPLNGTKDWTYMELCFRTHDKQNEVVIAARLGMYCSDNTGAAYFDDLSLVELDQQPPSFRQLSAPQETAKPSAGPIKFSMTWVIYLIIVLVAAVNIYFHLKKKKEQGAAKT
ncbi:MAG: carbohydrate binding domain-containing protein [Bacillota bacterium]